MKFRTDLAIERKELLDEEAGDVKDYDGVVMESLEYEGGVKCIRISVMNENGAMKLGKPEGDYITLEVEDLLEGDDEVKECTEHALAEELGKLLLKGKKIKTLVAGLGNRSVTPDALGPAAASKIMVTRHMYLILGDDFGDTWSEVSCIAPGVTGMTGIETADIIKGAVEVTRPDQVIIVDALASKSIKRVSTTIQINNTGIEPGSGMGNVRKALNEEYLGCRVVSVGVPTVIDAATIIREALEDNIGEAELVDRYMEEHEQELIVTSTDIDQIIKDFSDIIANSINKTLHPGIYS